MSGFDPEQTFATLSRYRGIVVKIDIDPVPRPHTKERTDA